MNAEVDLATMAVQTLLAIRDTERIVGEMQAQVAEDGESATLSPVHTLEEMQKSGKEQIVLRRNLARVSLRVLLEADEIDEQEFELRWRMLVGKAE